MTTVTENLSYIFSVISLIFYSIVYIPQFNVIYRSKSSSGISFWMILLWTQADILSLIGTIVLHMHFSIILIGWYHYIVGIMMILFVLYYTDRHIDINDDTTSKFDIFFKKCVEYIGYSKYIVKYRTSFLIKMLSATVFLLSNTIICMLLNITITTSHDVIGECLGWITMTFYLVGRIPQLWLNYKRKTTEGLSLLMYLFTMLGNGFYIAVITVDKETIQMNIPWIVTGVTTICLDMIVIGQHYYYKRNTANNNEMENILVR